MAAGGGQCAGEQLFDHTTLGGCLEREGDAAGVGAAVAEARVIVLVAEQDGGAIAEVGGDAVSLAQKESAYAPALMGGMHDKRCDSESDDGPGPAAKGRSGMMLASVSRI